MAYVNADAILAAVRSAVESGMGTARTITTGTYLGGLFAGQSPSAASVTARSKPAIETSLRVEGSNGATPHVLGSFALLDVGVDVRVVRWLDLRHETSDALRDDVKALSARDGDVLRQALTYPGNLTTDASSNATGLVSGMLRYEGSDAPSVEGLGDENGRIETNHRFSGIVQVTH